jgi:hypothetical protein
MPRATASISDLRIKDGMVAFAIESTGDANVKISLFMTVYDDSGTYRGQSDLGTIDPGESWMAEVDLPVTGLDDGDYNAWVYAYLYDEADFSSEDQPLAQQGVSFLIGRGRVFASTERASAPGTAVPPRLANVHLNGTWVVFDMINGETYDVATHHELALYDSASNEVHKAHGEELLRPGATQQGHYLLPEGLADGRYSAVVSLSREGSEEPFTGGVGIEVAGTSMTEVPLEW